MGSCAGFPFPGSPVPKQSVGEAEETGRQGWGCLGCRLSSLLFGARRLRLRGEPPPPENRGRAVPGAILFRGPGRSDVQAWQRATESPEESGRGPTASSPNPPRFCALRASLEAIATRAGRAGKEKASSSFARFLVRRSREMPLGLNLLPLQSFLGAEVRQFPTLHHQPLEDSPSWLVLCGVFRRARGKSALSPL